MLVNLLLGVVIVMLNALFSWLPSVTSLPTIAGYNLDSAVSTGMGYFYTYSTAFWYVGDVFAGFLVLLTYYGVKMLLKLILGHRAPASHH